MSAIGESLLAKIDAIITKSADSYSEQDSDANKPPITTIKYSFDRPNIDLLNSAQILGIISIVVSGVSLKSDIENNIRQILSSKEFREKIIGIKGSNSIKEDIEESFKQLVNPKTKKVKLPGHVKKASETKVVRLRDPKGRFTSLANIQVILNTRLAEQIRKNMGKGSASSILNYRTGRFAESARVDRLATDRNGIITAFYTYMKYPYQTFEPGYAQGSPKTRDPKLLISKSIREIAIELATTRLRTILV